MLRNLCKGVFLLLCVAFVSVNGQTAMQGVATNFQVVGSPYGACGVPESVLASEAGDFNARKVSELDYVALNVFHAPGNYQSENLFGARPLQGADTAWMGAYANGHNCGRWVEITLGDECKGNNGGEAGATICSAGTGWYADTLNGAKLFAIVTDQCSDNNAWCRDIPGHLDIHTQSLNHFRYADGTLIPPLATLDVKNGWVATAWNNREISWRYVQAPSYSGDVHLWLSQGSGQWWMQLIVTNLPNGIHGVEQWTGVDAKGVAQWVRATMGGDMGQAYLLPKPSMDTLRVRILDANDSLVGHGREYWIKYPQACGTTCSAPATRLDQGVYFSPQIVVNTVPRIQNNQAETAGQSILRVNSLRVNPQWQMQYFWKGQWHSFRDPH